MSTAPATNPTTTSRAGRRPRRRRWALAAALAIVCALLGGAGPAQARSAATIFTITGHGWGHGIGMSQWGAYGYAKHGWAYKAILKHYYTGVAFGTTPNDNIRVRLRGGLSSVKLTCAKPYSAAQTGLNFDIAAGVTATVTLVDGKYRVAAGGDHKDFSMPVTFSPSAGALRLLTATDLGNVGRYRGVIRVLNPDGHLEIINKLPLESYLRGVVPHESSPSWPAEALKAQACAARAYAQRSRHPNEAFDVYCTVRSQVYYGVGDPDVEKTTDAAVKATAGIVPTYKGAVISAFYFSTSGGHTENIENSWAGAAAVPYLKGVVDAYDSYSPLHTWAPAQRGAGEMANKLGSSVSGSLRAIYVLQRGSSPRIVKAAVIGSTGTQFLHGSILRSKLGLNDSWAFFRSMSISPAAADHASIAPGGDIELRGRLYQAAPTDASVTLHSFVGGAWHTQKVVTTRGSDSLGSGYSAKYSAYSVTLTPAATTTYYFTYGKATSPKTTVTVASSAPAATPTTPATQPTASPSPTPSPALSAQPDHAAATLLSPFAPAH
jgi:stage II sporulation protein D